MDATIKDIARKVNVSYATVSRALNDKHGVKAETKRMIVDEARRQNYRPNAIARGLVKRKTHSLGLIIPDITNPFYPEVARGVEDAAQKAGYSVFLCNTNWENSREIQYLELLAEKRVDGIIIAPIAKQGRDIRKLLGNFPIVFVSTTTQDGDSSCVTIDNIRGGYIATEYLIRKNKVPVGFIGSSEDSRTLEERLQGYKNALEANGIPLDERYIRIGDFKQESGSKIIKSMIGEGIRLKGVFGENDLLALGIIQGAKEMGLKVPEDLGVVGFDDIPIAGFPEIGLTTIAQPKYDMGRYSVEILVNRLGKEKSAKVSKRQLILEPRLIERHSV